MREQYGVQLIFDKCHYVTRAKFRGKKRQRGWSINGKDLNRMTYFSPVFIVVDSDRCVTEFNRLFSNDRLRDDIPECFFHSIALFSVVTALYRAYTVNVHCFCVCVEKLVLRARIILCSQFL